MLKPIWYQFGTSWPQELPVEHTVVTWPCLVSGVSGPGGVFVLWVGWGMPGLGGCVWSQGERLSGPRGSVSGPGRGSGLGGMPGLGDMSGPRVHVWFQGAVSGRGVGCSCWSGTPPVNRMTDTCKNITLATTLLWLLTTEETGLVCISVETPKSRVPGAISGAHKTA